MARHLRAHLKAVGRRRRYTLWLVRYRYSPNPSVVDGAEPVAVGAAGYLLARYAIGPREKRKEGPFLEQNGPSLRTVISSDSTT